MARQEIWTLRIPANKEGEKFFKQLKQYLNKDSYSLYKRFTGPRLHTGFGGHTRKENATSTRVYLASKRAEDNIPWRMHHNPFEYIQRGRDIEKGQQALRDADRLDEWDNLRARLDNAETELNTIKTLVVRQGARHRKG